jgi:hypothetical protein
MSRMTPRYPKHGCSDRPRRAATRAAKPYITLQRVTLKVPYAYAVITMVL